MDNVISEADKDGIVMIMIITFIVMVVLLVLAAVASNEGAKRSLIFFAGLFGGIAIGLFSLWGVWL